MLVYIWCRDLPVNVADETSSHRICHARKRESDIFPRPLGSMRCCDRKRSEIQHCTLLLLLRVRGVIMITTAKTKRERERERQNVSVTESAASTALALSAHCCGRARPRYNLICSTVQITCNHMSEWRLF